MKKGKKEKKNVVQDYCIKRFANSFGYRKSEDWSKFKACWKKNSSNPMYNISEYLPNLHRNQLTLFLEDQNIEQYIGQSLHSEHFLYSNQEVNHDWLVCKKVNFVRKILIEKAVMIIKI